MSQVIAASAPAKINLGLRILARRADGYHELESVFTPVDLQDRLRLRLEESAEASVQLTLTGELGGVPPGEDNLAARAARAFLAASGLSLAVAIDLDKQIPVGAGLGGGSSDAGAVLRGLAEARPEAIDAASQRALALSLGADVPYFLDPRPARVSGVGERVIPLERLPALFLLLVNPGVPLATAEVYRAFDALVPEPGSRDVGPGSEVLSMSGAPDLVLDNDLEPAAVRLCPALRRLRERLRGLDPLALGMSGSGATLFGIFPDRQTAEAARAAGDFPPAVWTRVAATLESG